MNILVTFHCCRKTLWPQTAYGNVYFLYNCRGIRVYYHGEEWQQATGVASKAGSEGSHSYSKEGNRDSKMEIALEFYCQSPPPSSVLPSTRPHHLKLT